MDDLTDLAMNVQQSAVYENLPPALQIALFLGALAFLPALLVCVTAYTRIVIVLSFVRRAVSTQEIPPNLVITGLSLFLTLFVMGPTLDEINQNALTPYLKDAKTGTEAVKDGAKSLHTFMVRQTRENDLALLVHLSRIEQPERVEDVPFRVLVPAYILSEIKTAFIMGFCLYVPFLLIDLVVASVLNALGMVTMPPIVISAPFKILLFVLADGWHLLIRALSLSFGDT